MLAIFSGILNDCVEDQEKKKKVVALCSRRSRAVTAKKCTKKRDAVKSCCLANLRACLHGSGGPQVGEVTCLGGVTCLSI